MGWKIELLHLGKMRCHKSRMIWTENRETTIEIPVFGVLLRHPEYGTVVYDTGLPDNWQNCLPEGLQASFPVTEQIPMAEALAKKGLSPEQVDMLILSHLHFDHAGGLRHFAGTQAGKAVIISDTELANGLVKAFTGTGPSYVRELLDVTGIWYRTISEEQDLFPGLRLFLQQSHAPGLIGIQVETDNRGPVLCVSDAVYTEENDTAELPPDSPNPQVSQGFLANLKLLQKRRRENGAVMLYGHDLDREQQWLREDDGGI